MIKKLTDQVRHFVNESEISRYAIATLANIDHGALSRFMAGNGGLSLDSLDRLAEVLGLSVEVNSASSKKTRRKKMSTEEGYENRQRQRVIRRVGRSPSHPNQYTYELLCLICGTRYGANGCDIDGANAGAGRRCPNPDCQNGTPGDPI